MKLFITLFHWAYFEAFPYEIIDAIERSIIYLFRLLQAVKMAEKQSQPNPAKKSGR
jgi:hypothetical protein